MLSDGKYILSDNIFLLEKIYNQFINDFWFDYLKELKDNKGITLFNIKSYRSIFGYFFENYISNIIKNCFHNAKYDTIRLFDELKSKYNGNAIEIADIYIRHNSKIIIGQVKSSSIYDKEKYSGNVDGLYKNNRAKFYETFGVDQTANSIKILNYAMLPIDKKFPKDKCMTIYPIIIVNERCMQTGLMAKKFQKRFEELLVDFTNSKIVIKPLSILHISDLEIMHDSLKLDHKKIWELLDYHTKNKKLILPFYHTLKRKKIKANYSDAKDVFIRLINKFNPQD